MENKLIEVLSQILEGINKDQSLKQVEKELKKNKKYDKRIVATAYSWIYDKLLLNAVKHKDISSQSTRIFNDTEITILGRDNYDRLQKLYNIGLLTNDDLDILMNQLSIIHPYDSVSNYEMNLLLLSSLFDIDRKILPGSRTLLYTSDKIN
jgi:hypothetical protein